MSKSDQRLRKLRDIYGRISYEEVIYLIDQLDDSPYGSRYLKYPTPKPSFETITPLTQKRLIKVQPPLD